MRRDAMEFPARRDPLRPRMSRWRSAWLAALGALCGVLASGLPGPAVHASPVEPGGAAARGREQEALVRVRLNDRPFATAVRLEDAASGEGVFLRVRDLARAVDGDGPSTRPRLRLAGDRLYAVALGGCEACTVQVRRTVLLSSRVRTIDREGYLPLEDVVRALEGRLERDDAGRAYGIFAGACTWCILEPKRAGEQSVGQGRNAIPPTGDASPGPANSRGFHGQIAFNHP